MDLIIDSWQMWVTFALIVIAVGAYTVDRLAMEITSICVIVGLMVFFHIFPVLGPAGDNVLSAAALLAGFANPALIAILALLVIGQGLFRSGALEAPTRFIADRGANHPQITLIATFLMVGVVSAFLNNTPVVVMFIPVFATLAARLGRTSSKVMMPLSFVSILGGMTTLIGSSTNLLVADIVEKSGVGRIGFFDFTVPGLVLAGVGLLYTLLVVPRLLPDREGLATEVTGHGGKQFIAQIEVNHGHPLVGVSSTAGLFPPLKNMTLRMIQRGPRAILPPFEDVTLQTGDVVIVAATRQTLTEELKSGSNILQNMLEGRDPTVDNSIDDNLPARRSSELVLAEAVVAPGSRMIGRNIEQVGFRYETGCLVLGIQRRSRMIRSRMSDIRLEAGDVLLVLGDTARVRDLRLSRDVLLLEWSTTELPDIEIAARARIIFGVTILAAVSGIVPIVVAAVGGAAAMIVTGVLNVRQASRAIDQRIFLLVGAALAMAAALERTGGAGFLAHGVVGLFAGAGPAIILSAFYLLVSGLTNLMSNNAAAVLFTPIAISTASELGVDPMVFAITVIFAANSSFATPMGYQTNLLVMGPGHYQFRDFLRGGLPLALVVWLAYSLFAPWYYGI